MCGIVGYVGARPALGIVLDGLRRLEYRGYDSAGVAVIDEGLLTEKRAGKLAVLERALKTRIGAAAGSSPGSRPDGPGQGGGDGGNGAHGLARGVTGIGHTRWATHGGPTDRNAHPHRSADGRIAVIHNGIIENFAKLRAELEERGIRFSSDTDTECAAHLVSEELATIAAEADGDRDEAGAVPATAGDRLAEAMRRVCRQLDGAFTLLAVDAQAPGVVVGARRNSPLVVGRGDGEYFLASDVSAFIEHTRQAIELGQDQVVTITTDGITITDFFGRVAAGKEFRIDWDASAAEKGGYTYFMLKEIAEQPRVVAETLIGRLTEADEVVLDEVSLSDDELRDISKITVVACGTAYHAGMVARYAIERWARIPCEVELASEFRYRDPVLDPSTLIVTISQSGETMDTLMALRHARRRGAKVLSICNTSGSTIPRESDAVLYTRGGPEIAVASTKAFLTQLVACYLVGLHLARVRGTAPDADTPDADTPGSGVGTGAGAGAIAGAAEIAEVVAELRQAPGKVGRVLEAMEPVRALGRDLAAAPCVLFIGRHVGYPVALEGALKLKELAYMHAEGFAAGELKHGPIALIDANTPVVCIVPSSRTSGVLHDKVVSNIQEVRARGARTIVIAEEGDDSVRPYADHLIPVPAIAPLLLPLVATVPLQVLAAEIATARGYDVDQPRNLAKSVTVE